jgi:hypothetical protein
VDIQARSRLNNNEGSAGWAKERRSVKGRAGSMSAAARPAIKEAAGSFVPRFSESRGLDRKPDKNFGAVPISIPLKSGAGT